MMRRDAELRPLPSLQTLALLACAALLSFAVAGCGVGLLHRGAPADVTAPAAANAGAPPADTDKRSRAEQRKDEREQAARWAADPLAEAHERMVEEPAEPWWPTRAAQLEAAAGHTAAAENSLRTALARDSAYAPALTQLSRMLYQQGRHDEAVRLLEPVRDHRISLSDADRTAVLSGLALHEAALGHDADARETLGALGHADRDDAVGVAGYLAVRGASADSALQLTEAAVKAVPGSAANHNNRGIALLRSADPDGAAREFERAIALDPTLPGPWYNMAILERWYRLDATAAAQRFQQYWTRSHADPDSLYAELGHGSPTPVAEEDHK
jgi:tetratricopeptide (TPR) repeat protein